MKKIGLMTWHHAENYGTAFQAYALKTLIEQLGYKVDLIDYRRLNSAPLDIISLKHRLSIKINNIIKKLLGKKNIFRFKEDTFGDFYNKNFTYSKKCLYNQDFQEINSLYDGFVCGSDQIWNPNWYDGRFYLDFVSDPQKMIAYSPSLGVTDILHPDIKKIMKENIKRISNLSVREKSGCEIVKKLTGRSDVYNVLDPVLMLNQEQWLLLEETFNVEGKYALIFFLANNDLNIRLSIKIAKTMGLNPVVLHCTQSIDTPYANTKEITPGQLLNCIRNSSYVFTDSFHVAVLSIIYHRQFITFKKQLGSNGNTQYRRILDLLDNLHINGGVYRNVDSVNVYIDYNIVDEVLLKKKSESLSYLRNALNSLPNRNEIFSEKCKINIPCKGEPTETFKDYLLTIPEGRKKEFMKSCQFALKKKCYRCKYLETSIIKDGRMPLFYNDIQESIVSKRNDLFKQYYQPFYFLNFIRKINRL